MEFQRDDKGLSKQAAKGSDVTKPNQTSGEESLEKADLFPKTKICEFQKDVIQKLSGKSFQVAQILGIYAIKLNAKTGNEDLYINNQMVGYFSWYKEGSGKERYVFVWNGPETKMATLLKHLLDKEGKAAKKVPLGPKDPADLRTGLLPKLPAGFDVSRN